MHSRNQDTTNNDTSSASVVRYGRIHWSLLALLALVAGTGLVGFDYWRTVPSTQQATFVGRQSCIECHRDQANAFSMSHHDLAMDLATNESVLGDFQDVTFEHHGLTNRLFRDGERFMVHTEGPDGKMQDFEVKYVFGVTPLQQYMVEFDRDANTPSDAIARLQVLRISWDTLNKKWFYLNPPDVTDKLAPDDDLHWTGIAQRWNTMCAECHSTNLQKNYDPQQTRYHTTFSEIDVSCEACHGPGSTHVELAQRKSLFWDRKIGYGLTQLKGENNDAQIQACAPCHSRRGNLAEGFTAGNAYCDFYQPSPLRAGLYHDDGQILDEVYVYGSFVQSKMYHKGIRCTDCHDPHSLQLKAKGNQVCTSCHQHPAGKYDTPSHHKHVPGTAGSACVDCHMPVTTYMELDGRRDHSLRIPRPDLSVSIGTPNACTGCHLNRDNVAAEKRAGLQEYADWYRVGQSGDEEVQAEIRRADQWCDDACEKWYGDQRRRESHFAESLHAFRKGVPGAADRLLALARDRANTSAIARATALDDLATTSDPKDLTARVKAGRESLNDPNPMVRAAAIEAVSGEIYAEDGGAKLLGQLAPLLDDPSRLVRSTAAKSIATTRVFRGLSSAQMKRFEAVLQEVRDGLDAISDRAGAHMEWALLSEARGNINEAIESYQTAMRVEPSMAGPRINLAGLLENLLQSQESVNTLSLEQVQATRKTIAELRSTELPLLRRDASLLPDNGNLQFRLGLAYFLNGDISQAVDSVQRALDLEPDNQEFSEALLLLKERQTTMKKSADLEL